MKILYLDFLYPKGHIRQNVTYINCLSKLANVYVVCPKRYYHDLSKKVKIIEKDSLTIKGGRFFNRLSSLKIMFISAIIARKLKPDYIFISSYETIMFSIGRLFFRNCGKLFILHHFNIDELDNKIKRWFFKRYMKKVDHVVFEDFIKNYLIETYKLSEKRIHVLPHQLNENILKDNYQKYACVGLSNSNDENIISEIVNKEKQEKIFKKAECKVILKSKVINFDDGFLKVVNNYLDDTMYNEYINNCKSIYMPFPSTFKYRMSGTLVDALSNNKIILCSNITLMDYYSKEYPSICKMINSVDDFFKYVIKINKLEINGQLNEFERFKTSHSEDKIVLAFKNMFDMQKY